MLLPLLLAAADIPPEAGYVLDRSRREAKAARAQRQAEQARPEAGTLPLDPAVAAKLQACLDAANGEVTAGLKFAAEWQAEKGGHHALQCKGYAHARAEQWDEAVTAFVAAAGQASAAGAENDAARLWAQAGNAALAGGKAEVALGHFDAALGHGLADGLAKGEVYLDRGRAHVALGKMGEARADLDQALKLAAPDPLAWLLSATLARRMDELARAAKDIGEAVRLAPDDLSVALEQGNIAALSGDDKTARTAWERVVAKAPDSPQAGAARAGLAQLPPVAGAAQPVAGPPQSR